ncbi:MAG: ribonuclease HII [Eubacterium sp.]|nr:ribonuclease HII [Eubacterium sp.]
MTKAERLAKMQERHDEMMAFDAKFRGTREEPLYIAGVDEVGRGPLAGPVVTAAVVLPEDFSVLGVDDSKKITEKRREELYGQIMEQALVCCIGLRGNAEIDRINILEATKAAMMDAIASADAELRETNGRGIDRVLIDAVHLPALTIPQTSIVKGDATSESIAAASIIAKVTRDRMMVRYAEVYPWYAFERNKGYGTAAHYAGIREHGITPIHRRSFLKNIL